MHSLHARIRILTLKKLIVCPDRKQYLKKAINNVKKKERHSDIEHLSSSYFLNDRIFREFPVA